MSISDNFANELTAMLAPIHSSRKAKLTLILHVGTPKTGTTSIQTYLDKKQRKLKRRGILYPNRSHNSAAPKHQWFEKNLVRIHPQNLLDNFQQILNDVDANTHTILLSSEGIYNHWWDFSPESKALLGVLNEQFDIKLWVWFREPLAFAQSFYKQCLRNPVVAAIPCYGKDLSFAEMLADPWFRQRLDYLDFVTQCDLLFGRNSMSIFEYQQDTVQTVIQLLGLTTPHDNPTPRQNNSINAVTTELYRVINRLELAAKEKEKIVPHLHQLNAVLTPYANKLNNSLIDAESRAKIEKMTAKAMLALQTRYIVV